MISINIKNKVHLLQKSEQEVCIFGAGRIGCGRGLHCLDVLDIRVKMFCDNNQSKWGQRIRDEIICISPEELQKEHREACVIIMLGKKDAAQVKKQLEDMGMTDIILMDDVILCDEYVDRVLQIEKQPRDFFENKDEVPYYCGEPIRNRNNKRIALYTCITGGYDEMPEPGLVESDVIDYYLITDATKEKDSVFTYVNVADIVPPSVTDNVRKNRFCKILGSEIFSEYQYSIYIDGNFYIFGKVSEYIKTLNDSGISLRYCYKPFDCVYVEGAWAMTAIDDAKNIRNQMWRYKKDGMPRHWGMFACGCMVRDNSNEMMKKIMREWWQEVYRYCYRDQLSFTYVLWKNGIKYDEIGIIDENEWDHSKEYSAVKIHDKLI